MLNFLMLTGGAHSDGERSRSGHSRIRLAFELFQCCIFFEFPSRPLKGIVEQFDLGFGLWVERRNAYVIDSVCSAERGELHELVN